MPAARVRPWVTRVKRRCMHWCVITRDKAVGLAREQEKLLPSWRDQGSGDTSVRETESKPKASYRGIHTLCVCMRLYTLLMDFHPHHKGVGGGCWCCLWLPECWVCVVLCGQAYMYVLSKCFCVHAYRKHVLSSLYSFSCRELGLHHLCWIQQILMRGCGSQKGCRGSLENLYWSWTSEITYFRRYWLVFKCTVLMKSMINVEVE